MRLIERMQHYVFPVSTVNPAGSVQEGLVLQTNLDAPFRLAGIAIWTNNAGGGSFDGQMALRLMRPDGRLIQRVFTPANALASGNQRAGNPSPTGANPNQALITPITPNIIYPANSVVVIDVQTLNPAVVSPSAIIVLVGAKLFRPGETWAPTYPPKFTARPYLNTMFVPSFSPSATPSLNNPFTVEQDADFVFQMGMYSDSDAATGGLVGSLSDLGFKLKDAGGKAYSNDYVPAPLLFPLLTAQQPGWTYPEIYIPAQQQLLFDFKYLWS